MWNDKNIVKIIKEGGVVVMPTDTVYGMVGDARNPRVVEHIYEIRNRDPKKPFIILIGDMSELKNFSITLTEQQKEVAVKNWPGPVSIIFDCPDESLTYLHRGTNSLAFRVPATEGLRNLLMEIGPLVAPSANLEKFPESESVEDARKYFGDKVDLYVDGGEVVGKASRVIKLDTEGGVTVLRP